MAVIFGHQSVGADLRGGIRELAATGAWTPQVSALGAQQPLAANAVIAAFPVGRNRNPQSKLRHFTEVTCAQAGANAQAARFKFCHVDVSESTDPDALFAYYRAAIELIQAKRPHLLHAHDAVALQTVTTGPVARFHLLLGEHDRQRETNPARHVFNQMLRSRYGGELLFDLAVIEARTVDAPADAARAPVLAPEYSSDGGHLSALGHRTVARRFLEFLYRAAARSRARRPEDLKATA